MANPTRKSMWRNRQSNECFYCRREMTPDAGFDHTATIDHRVPRGLGGTNAKTNVVLACRFCNQLKGGLTEEEFEAAIIYIDERGIKVERTKRGLRPIENMSSMRAYFGRVQSMSPRHLPAFLAAP